MKFLSSLTFFIFMGFSPSLLGSPVEAIIADGCDVSDYHVTEMTPIPEYPEYRNQSLILYFNNLSLYHDGQGEKSKICLVSSILNIPAGKQFRASNAFVSGVYNIPELASGHISFEYIIPKISRDSGMFEYQVSGQQDFQKSTTGESLEYTECRSEDQVINIDSKTELRTIHQAPLFSFIDLDTQQQTYSTRWNWEWKSCSIWFEHREFTSVYRAYNGRHYQAYLRFSGDQGSYDSAAGFTGSFKNVHFYDEGKTVTGIWEAEGKSGPFRFELRDLETGRFDGKWGDSASGELTSRWWGQFRAETTVSKTHRSLLEGVPQARCISCLEPS